MPAISSVAQRCEPRRLVVPLGTGQLQRSGRADDARHVLGARAAVALLRAAEHLWLDARSLAHVEDADTLGAVELVRRERQQVHAERRDIQIEQPARLHGVRVEGDATRPADAPDLGDGLDRSHLVVGVHERDQRGLVGDRRFDGRLGSTRP